MGYERKDRDIEDMRIEEENRQSAKEHGDMADDTNIIGGAFKKGDRVIINDNYSNNFLCKGTITGITENRCGIDVDNGNKEATLLKLIKHCR